MIADQSAAGPTILLASGHYFDLLNPDNSRFTVGDIAHGLANTCRFCGQCRRFYSVAEHSLHASRIVPEHLQLAALMHDAAEAFVGDVTRPLKSLLPAYREIEHRIAAVIADRFGLGDLCDDPIVKHADMRMLAAEQAALMPPHADDWTILAQVEPAPVDLRWPDNPVDAERKWLDRFSLLVNCWPAADLEWLPC